MDVRTESPQVRVLLETGPFAAALRAAIRARGLGLERIRYRLHARGVPVSLATLSYWQSGRCRPERPGSLAALAALEEVVEVPPGSLTRLLADCGRVDPVGSTRRRERDARGGVRAVRGAPGGAGGARSGAVGGRGGDRR